MNVVFLSPHFPPHYARFSKALRNAGATVLGIGDAGYDDLSPVLKSALTEYYRVADMNDYDALLKACGFFTHKYGKIDRFDSLNEYWLPTEARIRDDFNIFGIRQSGIDAIRRKSRMKAVFKKAGVPVARGQLVWSMDDAKSLIRQTGYPVVAKPDAGVGALHTYFIRNEPELDAFFNTRPDVDYIMEEFISGTVFSFDGLTDRKGRIVFATAHQFSQGIMEIVNEASHMFYHSLREIPGKLDRLGQACVSAFDVRERFFHMEFFLTPDERFVALEVNMRPPGGFTTDMFNYANDIDVYQAWADAIVYGRCTIHTTRPYHCCYASRKAHLPYIHTHDDIMARYQDAMMQVETVPGVFASALGDIGYIFRAPGLDTIQEIIAFIHAT